MPGIDDTRHTRSAHRRRPATAALAVATLTAGSIALSGCGSSGTQNTPTTPSTSEIELGVVEENVHNRQDAAFARDMILHHRQSIELARSAKGRTKNDAVLALAQRIETAQTPEITQLSRWLAEWRQPVPTASATAGYAIPGMVSTADIKALTGSTGSDFDRRFVTLMIANHEGAITQSQNQLKSGADERAKGLAADIAMAQESEITELRKLLG